MKRLLFSLPFLFVQFVHAQEYQKLKKEDIKVVIESKKEGKIDIVNKDNSPLSSGYYKAPLDKAEDMISFYVASNGKLNKTAEIKEGDYNSIIPLEDGLINGTIKTLRKDILVRETVFEKGIIRSYKNFDGDRLVEGQYNDQGNQLFEKKYVLKELVSWADYSEGKPFINQYAHGQMVSFTDEANGSSGTYHENGKIATMAMPSDDGSITEKEFTSTGRILMEKVISPNRRSSVTKYFYGAGKQQLRILEENDGQKIKRKEYDQDGKLIKSTVADAPPSAMDIIRGNK